MQRMEVVGRILVILIVIGVPLLILGYQRVYVPAQRDVHEFHMAARAPENGGWMPRKLTVHKGDRVRLVLTSEDVAHGFGLQGHDLPREEVILPGKIKVIEFTTDKEGSYRFFCTIVCGKEHSAMMGELVVAPQPHLLVAR